ncbi:hypothetical protein C1646_755671 [Rhizophagus diaphanus]|nr:hypothetical protein C1646_755671 [Rhizophagus diaphanus] [Rhizophagus sp. MUCL 43196]
MTSYLIDNKSSLLKYDKILRYSLETAMIMDSPIYNIEHRNINLHLYSFFKHPPKVNLVDLTTFSILWSRYIDRFYSIKSTPPRVISFSINEFLLFYNNYDTFGFTTFLNIFHLIHSRLSRSSIPTITFMISYIKFVNYPRDYNYIFDLFWPKPSPFINIINRDIYKTWNGEALINFKWNTYGKYYYFIICILFMALLGCFTAVATIPQDYLNENLKRNLLKTSITLGSFHLIQKIRQIIYNLYNLKKWIRNYWDFFDLGAYLIPTATSIYWLNSNNENTSLLSFSCLLLDIKFLLFFRAFESFVFAHAFLVLLKPKLIYVWEINDDLNDPWLNKTYYNQIINGTTAQNASLLDENTNMFTDYGTALFAIYLFLIGDPSALSNKWRTSCSSIEKDNNRISYLTQKAEILAEIELFYLLPCQRRWKAWFPEVIYYYADVVKTREKVKEMISKGEWNINDFPELKKDLLDKLNIQYNPANSEIVRRDA